MRPRTVPLLAFIATMVLSTAAAWLVLHEPPITVGPPVRVVLGSLATLVLPGYACAGVLFGPNRIHHAERLLISLGLSILICMGATFVLHSQTGGLSATNWARLLWSVTAVASIAASIRSSRAPADGPVPLAILPAYGPSPSRPRWQVGLHLVAAVAAVALLITTVLAGIGSAQQQPYPGFTQFWLLPQTQHNATQFELGIGNFEGKAYTYQIELYHNDHTLARWSQLVVGDTDTLQLPFVLREPLGTGDSLTAVLYRADQPTQAYRQVRVWRNALQAKEPSS